MKRFIGCIVGVISVLVMINPCWSDEAIFGVGISATEDGTTLYFPVKMGHLLVEPLVSYDKRTQTDTFKNSNYSGTSDTKEKAVGLGFFGIVTLNDHVDMIVGTRVIYVDYHLKDSDSLGTIFGDRRLKGFEVVPTVGIEYYFNDHVSLGGSIGYSFQSVSGDYAELNDTGTYYYEYEREVESASTESALFVKYYF